MSAEIIGLLYCDSFALEEETLSRVSSTFNENGWAYNLVIGDGFWRDDVGDWIFEETTDDQQDNQKLQNAVRNVVEAGGGAISFSRAPPTGRIVQLTLRVYPPSAETDYWRIAMSEKAAPFSGEENRTNQRILVDVFTDVVTVVSPYIGTLQISPAVYEGFDGDFTAPPEYFTGVTYLSYDVPGVPLEDLPTADVAHRVVELPDGVLVEPCEGAAPWSCQTDDVAPLEAFLGMDYYPG